MIYYSGLGCFGVILFFIPTIVIGLFVLPGYGIYVFRTGDSWWPLHSLMILGALLLIVVGRLANRKKVVKDVIYEKSGPELELTSPHTIYGIPMEYWGPIFLVIYFALAALIATTSKRQYNPLDDINFNQHERSTSQTRPHRNPLRREFVIHQRCG